MKLDQNAFEEVREHGSESWSFEVDWIDLETTTDDSGTKHPRDDTLNIPRKRGQTSTSSRRSKRQLNRTYFQSKQSLERTLQENIIQFFHGLFHLADAILQFQSSMAGETESTLHRIHFKMEPLDKHLFGLQGTRHFVKGPTFQECHQDLKPENIFVFPNNLGLPKAESGPDDRQSGANNFSKPVGISAESLFHKLNRDSQPGYWALTYGAPECHRLDEKFENLIEQGIPNLDLWSLGSVFSEAAVWLLAQCNDKEKSKLSKLSAERDQRLTSPTQQVLCEEQIVESPPGDGRKICSALQSHLDWKHILGFEPLGNGARHKSTETLLQRILEGSPNMVNDEGQDGLSPLRCDYSLENFNSLRSLESVITPFTRTMASSSELGSLKRPKLPLRSCTYATLARDRSAQRYLQATCEATESMDDTTLYGSWAHTITQASRRRDSASLIKGSGHWLLEDEAFIRWQNKPEGTFWLTGSPGSGKSTLASMVFEALRNSPRNGERFVDFHAQPEFRGHSTVVRLLWEILIQIRFQRPAAGSHLDLQLVLADLIFAGERISLSQMKYIFSKMRHSMKSHETLYLFVDGLTEYECRNERDLIYELFTHAARSDPNHRVKLFVSSSSRIFGTRHLEGTSQVDLDSHPNAQIDLALCRKAALQNLDWDKDSDQFPERILDLGGSHYLRAQLILNSSGIASGSASPSGPLSNSKSADLHTLYSNLLGQIENPYHEIANVVFGWIALAARPLFSPEMLGALNMRRHVDLKSADVVKICGNLVVIDKHQIVRFSHYSVMGFFESVKSDKWNRLSMDTNETIVDTCLQTLYPESLLRSLRLPAKKLVGSETEKFSGHRLSLLSYAYRYWIFHYRLAEPKSSYIAGLLHNFLSKSLPSLDLVNTALWVGARFGFRKLVRLELDMGANINMTSGLEENTPLIWAAKSGHLEVVRLLLAYGADPQIPSRSGCTPIMVAAINGHPETVKLLSNLRDTKCFAPTHDHGLASSIAVAETVTQELFVERIFSEPCTTCGAVETGYQLSAVHDSELPPVTVRGEYISQAEMELWTYGPSLQARSPSFMTSKQQPSRIRTIKWFPGPRMHRALEAAARRGMEDLKKLLAAVGNDINDLDGSLTVGKLVAKMQIL